MAGACVASIIASGIIPVALEFMDRPAIHACEAFAHAGYPLDAEAMLIIEVEGSAAEQDELLGRIQEICARHDPISLSVSASAEESAAIWKGRKGAFGAVGRISPDYLCMDGVIPTSRLAEVLRRIGEMERRAGLQVANIFHAGDGNLHPLIMFDANDPDSFRRAEQLGADILTLCVEVGGCLTGEHGVGVEKRDLMGVQFTAHRTGPAAPHQIRLRSGLAAQPVESVPAAGGARMSAALAAEPAAPADEAGVAAAVRAACAAGEPLLVLGNGTKRGMLRPVQAARVLSTARPDRHHAVFAAGTGAVGAGRHDGGRSERGGGGEGPADHRRNAGFFRLARQHRARRPWAGRWPPTCPARAGSPGGRCATTCSACAR